MISTAILFVFLSFYIFFNTSKRAVKHCGFGFEKWIKNNTKSSKIIAILLLFGTAFLHIVSFGFGSGMLIFFIVLMMSGSLIILLTPLKLITYKSFLMLFLGVLCAEIFLF
tara:strand:+ start:48549 stop:48881 length:333 start_codon:yes stop_codon:yes gene_type:complete